jgi:hypothetical protein
MVGNFYEFLGISTVQYPHNFRQVQVLGARPSLLVFGGKAVLPSARMNFGATGARISQWISSFKLPKRWPSKSSK